MKHNCIIVLGMHRSGTSVATALCELQGVFLSSNLFAEREDNPKGFFEHAEIIDLNEKVFNTFGLHSQDVVPLPKGFEELPEITPIQKQIIAIIQRDFSSSLLWGIKDPRMCLLMPLWHKIFSELALSPQFLIPYRHPLEVAKSLHARDKISIAHGLLLWLRYTLEILIQTEKQHRVFISFDDLLSGNFSCFQALKLPHALNVEKAQEFLDHGLRRQSSDQKEAAVILTPWVMEVFSMLPNPNMLRVHEIQQALMAILDPAAKMTIAKGKIEHYLRAQLTKKKNWLSWLS